MKHLLLPALTILALGFALHAGADEPAQKTTPELKLPPPSEIKRLQVEPATIKLVGADESRQLIITGALQAGGVQDLSGDVKYELSDPKIISVTPSGRILPLANGSATVTARYGDKTISAIVTAESMDVDLPINFRSEEHTSELQSLRHLVCRLL